MHAELLGLCLLLSQLEGVRLASQGCAKDEVTHVGMLRRRLAASLHHLRRGGSDVHASGLKPTAENLAATEAARESPADSAAAASARTAAFVRVRSSSDVAFSGYYLCLCSFKDVLVLQCQCNWITWQIEQMSALWKGTSRAVIKCWLSRRAPLACA